MNIGFEPSMELHGHSRHAIQLMNRGGEKIAELNSDARLDLGGGSSWGYISLLDSAGNESMLFDGNRGSIGLGDWSGNRVMFLDPNAGDGGKYSALFLGEGKAGIAVLRNKAGNESITR